MTPQFNNNLLASVYLWTENRIGQLGQAYITTTAPLYYAPDPRLPTSLLSYASPWRQWVYDSGVSGAQIIQSVSGSAGILNRSSGLMFDYTNGRVLVPSTLGTNLALTGTMSFKEINSYLSNETEEYLLTQGQFFLNPRYVGTPTGGLPPYSMATPAVFVNMIHDSNEAFALGGLDDCTTTISMVCLLQSNFQLQAVMSMMRDARYKYIPMLSVGLDPLNQWGDTYSGYNYQSYITQYGAPGQLIYIKEVKTSRVSDRIKLNPELYMGLVDMDVSYIRATT